MGASLGVVHERMRPLANDLEPLPDKQGTLAWGLIGRWLVLQKDVALSISSLGIFSVCAAFIKVAYGLGYTHLYSDPRQCGLWYLGASLIAILICQDAYFYFIHRLAHHPSVFRRLHQGHHQSKHPTPWTAFSFDPGEAFMQALYLVGVVFLIPVHLSVLTAVLLVMNLAALFHHSNLGLFEASAVGRWLGQWLVGPAHHRLHHRKFTVHYSLYFTFWDRWLGT